MTPSNLCDRHRGVFAYFVLRVQPAVVFTADMWRADVLFNKVTHSPANDRHRQRSHCLVLLCKRKRVKRDQGTNPQFNVKWIIEVSQPVHLKIRRPFQNTYLKLMRKGHICADAPSHMFRDLKGLKACVRFKINCLDKIKSCVTSAKC